MKAVKSELRDFFYCMMTKEWAFSHSQNRKFSGANVELKKEVFYKYLVYFTQELYEGEIQPLISRKKVLSIQLFQ